MAEPPRTDKTCSDPVSVGFGETFTPQTTITMFSRPFHAREGANIRITLKAELNHFDGNPDLAIVAASVHQCCEVSDSDINGETVGAVGPANNPAKTTFNAQVNNRCDLPSKFGDDFIYYLRLRIDSPNQTVVLGYMVE